MGGETPYEGKGGRGEKGGASETATLWPTKIQSAIDDSISFIFSFSKRKWHTVSRATQLVNDDECFASLLAAVVEGWAPPDGTSLSK